MFSNICQRTQCHLHVQPIFNKSEFYEKDSKVQGLGICLKIRMPEMGCLREGQLHVHLYIPLNKACSLLKKCALKADMLKNQLIAPKSEPKETLALEGIKPSLSETTQTETDTTDAGETPPSGDSLQAFEAPNAPPPPEVPQVTQKGHFQSLRDALLSATLKKVDHLPKEVKNEPGQFQKILEQKLDMVRKGQVKAEEKIRKHMEAETSAADWE